LQTKLFIASSNETRLSLASVALWLLQLTELTNDWHHIVNSVLLHFLVNTHLGQCCVI